AALQVVDPGVDDVYARVRVVDPVDRYLVDAQACTFGDHQQLGVEEPAGVGDQRQQLPGHFSTHGLEAALRIGEVRAEHASQNQVVTASSEFPFWPAHHP